MKLWVDDVRPAPYGYVWVKTVNDAILQIEMHEAINAPFSLIDVDHDAGDWVYCGGDYIKLLDWLEETDRYYSIHIHSLNVVGVENMRRIIERNGWTEVK